MAFADVHPLVLVIWSLANGTAAIFVWLTLSNLASLRRFDDPALRLYAVFTAIGALDATLVALSFVPMPELAKAELFKVMWASGGLVLGLWMRSVTRFVGAGEHRLILVLSRLLYVLALIVVLDVVWTLFGGTSLMFEYRPRGSSSILIAASGDVFRHRPLADLVAASSILVLLVASIALLIIVRRERPDERLVLLGVVLTAVFASTQAGLAGTDSKFTAPLLFMANLIEAMRITWVSRVRIGEELEAVRREQEEQAILLDHQLEQLQLSDRMATLGEHTAQVTHDLRNPLSAVLAGVEFAELELAEPEPDHARLAESLAIARTGLEHTLTLVRRITRQARASGPAPLETLALGELLDAALSLVRPRLSGVQIERAFPEDLRLRGRSTELIQLLVNLISNACDAMEGLEERRITVRARAGSEHIELELEDAGQRPPDAIVARMFKQRFTTRADAEGTGLGLAICARVVRQHGGTIEVDPQAPHTTIRVTLPRAG